jgi:hypothetical protein
LPPQGITKSIIGVFTSIQGMNILGYGQHGEITIMDWKLIHVPTCKILGPKVLNPWITKQMLGEAFNDFVSPTNHEGFNVFT